MKRRSLFAALLAPLVTTVRPKWGREPKVICLKARSLGITTVIAEAINRGLVPGWDGTVKISHD